jgi:hypothetical protein
MPATATRAQAGQQQMRSRFREDTRQQEVVAPALTLTSFGTAQNILLPQTGYLANLYINVTANITIPAAPSGNWATFPALPWAFIRKLRVFTSETVEIVNVSGWGLFLSNLTDYQATNMSLDPLSYLNTTGVAALYTTKSGALVAGTYPITFSLKVPICTDDAMMLGLLNTQNNDVRVFLEITPANPGDLVSVGGTLPTVLSMVATANVEFYTIPPSGVDFPNQVFVSSLTEQILPVLNTGDWTATIPLGNIYTKILGVNELPNAQINDNTINNISIFYAQAVRPYYETYYNHLVRNKFRYGFVVPDGMFCYDFTGGAGGPPQWDPRDFMNSSRQTDLKLDINYASITAGQQVRLILRQLAPIS